MICDRTSTLEDHLESWDIAALDLQPHRPQVLRSDEHTRAIAINLPAGEMLQEHETHERAYLIVTEGQIEVEHRGEIAEAGAGFVAHFRPQERREVRAKGDSRLLLILAPWPGEGHPSAR
ncbi:MAG: cupin domain-containing protein [Actinomycetota bacterium]|nr:cupin domain-containing protein [Actinomycetota bacterium]